MAGGRSGTFNLGTVRGYSVKEVLDAIAAEADVPLKPLEASRRLGIPLCLSPTQLWQGLSSALRRPIQHSKPLFKYPGLGISGFTPGARQKPKRLSAY